MSKIFIIQLLYAIMALLMAGLCGCSVIRNSPKYELANGYYQSKVFSTPASKVYLINEEEVIRLYATETKATDVKVDTTTGNKLILEKMQDGPFNKIVFLRQGSFDLDVLTIPVKYRFMQTGFPRQLNTNLNGAVYIGYRSDVYSIRYKSNPLGKSLRIVNHYGFSFGGFTGLGATPMNPWVTNNQIAIEYDGIVWLKGIASIIAINNFTVGMALGWDQLLDSNKRFWTYKNKPWLGIVFGLNLN